MRFIEPDPGLAALRRSWAPDRARRIRKEEIIYPRRAVYGAGVQYAFAPKWSAGLEYVIYDFDSETETNPDGYRMDVETQVDVVRFTLNYDLN